MFTDLYEQGIDLHIQRWNFPRSHTGWLSDIGYVFHNYAEKRPCMMTGFILDYFEITEEEFGFICDSGIGDLSGRQIVYPNPAHSVVKVKINNWQGDVAYLRIFNEMGQIVLDMPLSVSAGKVFDAVNISGLKPGLYFFKVWGKEKMVVTKLIKTSN